MKIVHSLWTRPWRGQPYPKVASGFLTPIFNWACATYSCLKAKEIYGNCELITDSAGANAVKSLGIPYDKVTLELDSIPSAVPPSLWAYGKIVAYSLQTEPFWHIDCDSIILEKMPSLESADVVYQYEESPAVINWGACYPMTSVMNSASYKPVGWDTYNTDKKALCMGIFGGNNLDAIHAYAEDVIHVVTGSENVAFWQSRPWWNNFNVTIEQHAAYCFFKQQGQDVTPYLSTANWPNRFQKTEFCHLMARKTDKTMYNKLMDRLAREFPSDYLRLKNLLR